jgi:hypothetical protein
MMDNCERCGKTCYVRVIGMQAGKALCVDCVPVDVAAIENSVVRAKNAEIARLRETLAQPHMVWAAEQHSVGVDIAAEDVRLRAELAAARPIVEAAKAWRSSHHTGHQSSSRPLIDAIDAALAIDAASPPKEKP